MRITAGILNIPASASAPLLPLHSRLTQTSLGDRPQHVGAPKTRPVAVKNATQLLHDPNQNQHFTDKSTCSSKPTDGIMNMKKRHSGASRNTANTYLTRMEAVMNAFTLKNSAVTQDQTDHLEHRAAIPCSVIVKIPIYKPHARPMNRQSFFSYPTGQCHKRGIDHRDNGQLKIKGAKNSDAKGTSTAKNRKSHTLHFENTSQNH